MRPEDKRYILESINKKSVQEIARVLGLKERKVKKFLQLQKYKHKGPDTPVKADRPAQTAVSSRKKNLLAPVLLIILACFLAYGNSLDGKLLWDDNILLKNNVYIQNWSNLQNIFTKSIGAASGESGFSYRPVQMFVFMLAYSVWGLNVIGYHILSVIAHTIVVLCLYWLINVLYKDRTLSLLASLLYAVFPLHTSAVSYISGLADPLAAFFILLSLTLYIKNLDLKNIFITVLASLSFVCAILSKEYALVLIFLILLYHYTFKRKIRIMHLLPFIAVAFAYLLIRATALASLLPHTTYATTLLQRIPGFFVAITNYARLLLLPVNLHVEYGLKIFNFSDPRAAMGVIILISALTYGFLQRNKNRLVFFSVSWFFITLLPQSNLYPIHYYMAEHWMYLPSIGFFLILASGLTTLYKKDNLKAVSIFLIAALLATYTCLTIRQNRYWKDPISFFNRSLKYVPDNAVLCNDLATAYIDMGKREEAAALYERAIEADPNQIWTYDNLALLYKDMGRYEEARQMLKKLLEIKPDYPKAYNTLGTLYRETGDKEEAAAMYRKAVELRPDFADAYNNLAITYQDLGKKEEAVEFLEKAVALVPNDPRLYYNLGNAYMASAKYEKAISSFNKALTLQPDNKDAYNNLGSVYYSMGQKDDAVAAFSRAIEIDSNFAQAYRNIAVVYCEEKKFDLAIRYYDKAVGLGYSPDPTLATILEPFREKKN